MANINVRGLSERTKATLRVRAAEAGMSLEASARRTLQRAAATEAEEPPSTVALAKRLFGQEHGIDLVVPRRSGPGMRSFGRGRERMNSPDHGKSRS